MGKIQATCTHWATEFDLRDSPIGVGRVRTRDEELMAMSDPRSSAISSKTGFYTNVCQFDHTSFAINLQILSRSRPRP